MIVLEHKLQSAPLLLMNCDSTTGWQVLWKSPCTALPQYFWFERTVSASLADRCCGSFLSVHCLSTFPSFQFKMVSKCSEKLITHFAPSPSSFPNVAMETLPTVRLTDNGPPSSFQGKVLNASSFHASLLQAIDGAMWCPWLCAHR